MGRPGSGALDSVLDFVVHLHNLVVEVVETGTTFNVLNLLPCIGGPVVLDLCSSFPRADSSVTGY